MFNGTKKSLIDIDKEWGLQVWSRKQMHLLKGVPREWNERHNLNIKWKSREIYEITWTCIKQFINIYEDYMKFYESIMETMKMYETFKKIDEHCMNIEIDIKIKSMEIEWESMKQKRNDDNSMNTHEHVWNLLWKSREMFEIVWIRPKMNNHRNQRKLHVYNAGTFSQDPQLLHCMQI